MFLTQRYFLDELPYQVKWYPAGPLFTMAMYTIVIAGQSYEAFDAKEGLNVTTLLSSYISLPLLLRMWTFYKTAIRSPKVKSVDIDLFRTSSGVRESEEALGG